MCRDMRTGQTLFSLRIELGISQVCLWKEFLVTGAQTTWLHSRKLKENEIQ